MMLFGCRRFVHKFTCQLLFLLEEGVPFLKAMELIALQYPRRRRYWNWNNVILDVRHRVREGESFSQALSHYNKVFDQGYLGTIAWADGSSAKLLIALRLLSNNLTGKTSPPSLRAFSVEYDAAENKAPSTRN